MSRRPPDLEGFITPGSEDDALLRAIDLDRLPSHIAIIMDGNGRWAQLRRLPRVGGHREGINAVRDIVETSARLGLDVLTLYAFSKENWKRPRTEINMLMALLKEYINRELRTLIDNKIRFQAIGRLEELDRTVQGELRKASDATAHLDGMTFNIALSYGGRAEIVDACRGLVNEVLAGRDGPASAGEVADRIDEGSLARHLYTSGQPDPDLLIRTSGELRISNFLLWQIAYAEIWVTDTLWPDFRRAELFRAILDYQKRDRRYGGVGEARGSRDPESVPGKRRVV